MFIAVLIALVLIALYIVLFHTSLILMFLTVSGRSMYPTLVDGEKLWSVRTYLVPVEIGDIVVAKPYALADDPSLDYNRLVIKRVHRAENGYYYLLGDNPDESYDSRNYGWVSKKEIVAKVMM